MADLSLFWNICYYKWELLIVDSLQSLLDMLDEPDSSAVQTNHFTDSSAVQTNHFTDSSAVQTNHFNMT